MKAHCEMCGFEAPIRPDGRCFLGHRVFDPAHVAAPSAGDQRASAALAEAPPPSALAEAPAPDRDVAGAPPVPAGDDAHAEYFSLDWIHNEFEAPDPSRVAPPEGSVIAPAGGDAPAPTGSADGVAPAEEAVPVDGAAPAEEAAPAESAPPVPSTTLFGSAPPEPPSRSRRFVAGLVALVLVVAGAGGYLVFGPGSGSAEAAHYRRVFRAEETHRYVLQVTFDGSVSAAGRSEAVSMGMDMAATEEVLDVTDDGVATVRYTIDGLNVTANGAVMPLPFDEGLSITARIAPDGQVLEMSGLTGLSLSGNMGPAGDLFGPASMGPLLPDHAVAPGDTWSASDSYEVPGFEQPLRVDARNKLLRLETINGERAAVIRSDVTIPFDIDLNVGEMLEAMADQLGGIDPADAGMPLGAVIHFRGGIEATMFQTVVADTGRPISVSGDGTMDVTMSMSGMAGIPEMSILADITLNFGEVEGSSPTGTVA